MIARVRGTVSEVRTGSVLLDLDDLTYEVYVPAVSVPQLRQRLGQRVTLHTLQYIEGNSAYGNQVPRLVGFLSEAERDFFLQFIKVPGIGIAKGLRSMTVSAAEIASAIEGRNIAALAKLPGLGRRTAEKAIAELHGKLQAFGVAATEAPEAAVETPVQAEAVEALISLGYRRGEAEELVSRTLAAGAIAENAGQLVQACFRHAQR
jgi:Holliday junction DNA helicase RuvA